jgi:protoporphyrinogen oxidase
MNLILGAGLSGLSCSYHLGHEKCLLLEAGSGPYGHIGSEMRDGFTWDQGPHVSFTKDDYVRELFAESVGNEYEEYTVRTRNYFEGDWIEHPAQCHLYQIPEPLRSRCLADFHSARATPAPESPANYAEWLQYAFGKTFAETFPAAYTRKYWTVEPKELGTDWIGQRVFFPSAEDIEKGYRGPLDRETHYITKVRYPTRGGYQAFAKKMRHGANILTGHEVVEVDLAEKKVSVRLREQSDTKTFEYSRLISTLPLPEFVKICKGIAPEAKEAAEALNCSELLLVNISVPHPTMVEGNWFYIYDEKFLSTRINYTERLSPHNAPEGSSGIQVEVYAYPKKGFTESHQKIANKVIWECVKMGFINEQILDQAKEIPISQALTCLRYHTKYCKYANVICDHSRKEALDCIFTSLEPFGLSRADADLHPYTDWTKANQPNDGDLMLAGRFGQWKYYWTDDCVLRGKAISENAKSA